jgi:hypothetical protein
MQKLLGYLTGTIKCYGLCQDGASKGSSCRSPFTVPSGKQNLSAALTVTKKSHCAGALRSNLSHTAKVSAVTIDQGLAAAGVAVAAVSFAFAVFMVSQNGRWTGFEREAALRLPPQRSTAFTRFSRPPLRAFSRQPIDFGTTGSISQFRPGHQLRRAKAGNSENQASGTTRQQSASYVLSFVYKKMALVKGRHGFYAAKVGTALPAAGNVLSIEKLGNHWVLVTERAVIAEGK